MHECNVYLYPKTWDSIIRMFLWGRKLKLTFTCLASDTYKNALIVKFHLEKKFLSVMLVWLATGQMAASDLKIIKTSANNVSHSVPTAQLTEANVLLI